MRRIRFVSPVLVMLVLLPGCKRARQTEFSSEEGRFQAVFPGEPKEKAQSVQVGGEGLNLHVFFVTPNEHLTYLISYVDYSSGIMAQSSSEEHLARAVEGAVQEFEIADMSVSDTELDGHVGKDVTFSGVDKGGRSIRGRRRIFLVGNRLYQLLILSLDSQNLTEGAAQGFFESFKLLDPPS